MLLSFTFLVIGLVLLVLGGDLVVRGAVRLAERMGVSAALVGTVIVGFGTSLPELAASLDAAFSGAPGIAWGNIVGSNIANTLLILGAAALLWPISTMAFQPWRDPFIAVLATLAFYVLLLSGWQTMPAGALLVAGLCVYVWWCYRLERSAAPAAQTSGPHSRAEALEDLDPALHAARDGFAMPVLLFIGGLAVLVGGARLLVMGAVDLAEWFGLSEAVIGLTVVAIGTSLPELAASAIAAMRREGGIALGNVLGSNIYNILGIGGATLLAAPGSIPPGFAGLELPVLLVLSIALFLLVWRRMMITRFIGAVLLLLYAVYLAGALAGWF